MGLIIQKEKRKWNTSKHGNGTWRVCTIGRDSASYISTLLIKVMPSARMLMTDPNVTPINQACRKLLQKCEWSQQVQPICMGKQRLAATQTYAEM